LLEHLQAAAGLVDEVIELIMAHPIHPVLLSAHPFGGIVSINRNIIDRIGVPIQSIQYPLDALDDTLGGETIIDALGDLELKNVRMLAHCVQYGYLMLLGKHNPAVLVESCIQILLDVLHLHSSTIGDRPDR